MFGLPLTFTVPLVLTALAALPAIWLLLRITPPQPRRVDFPPLKILADLRPEQEMPARTPWWLLLLRLLLAAFLILAAAGPDLEPAGGRQQPRAAPDRARQRLCRRPRLARSHEPRRRAHRGSGTRRPHGRARGDGGAARRTSSLEPLRRGAGAPALPQASAASAGPSGPPRSVRRFLESTPDADIVWISDGVAGVDGQGFIDGLAPMAGEPRMTVLKAERAPALAVAGVENAGGRLNVRLMRAEPNGRDSGTVRALDLKSLPLADMRFAFDANATETDVAFDLPTEIRNAIARIEILGEGSAGAVHLLDERGKRRRVGLVFGGTSDQAQPLLSPLYYIERALAPFAEIREGRGAVADAVNQLIDEQVSVLVLADVGGLDRETLGRSPPSSNRAACCCALRDRGSPPATTSSCPCACAAAAAASAAPSPGTRRRPSRRSPARARSSASPCRTRSASAARSSPSPTATCSRKTWAALADGTPIVTADKRGDGLIVLFHVTADTTWSNLPLSGLFVDMLRRIVALAGAPSDARCGGPQCGERDRGCHA